MIFLNITYLPLILVVSDSCKVLCDGIEYYDSINILDEAIKVTFFRIIEQCLNNIPEGDISTDDAKCVPPTRHEMKVTLS
jgi:hypothetical protein